MTNGGRVSVRLTAGHRRVGTMTAAAALFAEVGLGATQAAVAQRAGVGVATLYRRHGNKEDLVLEVYQDRLFAGVRLAGRALRYQAAWDGLRLFLGLATTTISGDLGHRQLILGDYARHLGPGRSPSRDRLEDVLREHDVALRRSLQTLISRAIDQGSVRPDLEVSDVYMISAAVVAASDMGGTEQPRLHGRMLSLIADGLRRDRTGWSPLLAPSLTVDQLRHATRGVPTP